MRVVVTLQREAVTLQREVVTLQREMVTLQSEVVTLPEGLASDAQLGVDLFHARVVRTHLHWGWRFRNVKRFLGGLVFEAHRLLYHSTLGLRVIKKKRQSIGGGGSGLRFEVWGVGIVFGVKGR